MPRLSLYRPQKSNDYKFLDRTIKEMFTAGGTDLYIHKYVGIADSGPSSDFTQPQYSSLDPTNIQDLLFLENRDRKYDSTIYRLRGHYNVQNLDFDLSQFGLFLNNDVIFITVHYNEMIDLIGRKLMVGDVFELPHLTDYHPLNETIPIGLRRYYQITDANFASEGFTQTWYPHLWRIKCEPLVDSQEFSNILSKPISQDNYLGDWDKTKTYVPGYVVTYGDKNYTAIIETPVGTPCSGETWSSTTEYPAGTVVAKDGITYVTDRLVPAGTPITNTTYYTAYWQLDSADSLKDIIGRYNKNIEINDAAIAEAARIVPKTGYDRSQLYIVPTFNGQPELPSNILSNPNAPTPIRGLVALERSPLYRNASPSIRIGAAARKELFTLTESDIDALAAFMQVSLESATLAPERTDTGSGPVKGTTVLAVKAIGPITGPYGTSDNTYSAADQFPSLYFQAAENVPIGSTVIPVTQVLDPEVPDTWYENPGINVASQVSISATTGDTNYITVFPDNTLMISVDTVNNTFTMNQATIAIIPKDASIKIASTFTGEPIEQNIMDYRADADPRFNYIKRFSPQGFGYLNGYLAGDATFPNGLPAGAGITFPANPNLGDYFLRIDYLPNLLYRYDGNLWVRIGENVRANGDVTNSSETMLGSFINNTDTTTLTDGTVIPQAQPLSSILNIQVD